MDPRKSKYCVWPEKPGGPSRVIGEQFEFKHCSGGTLQYRILTKLTPTIKQPLPHYPEPWHNVSSYYSIKQCCGGYDTLWPIVRHPAMTSAKMLQRFRNAVNKDHADWKKQRAACLREQRSKKAVAAGITLKEQLAKEALLRQGKKVISKTNSRINLIIKLDKMKQVLESLSESIEKDKVTPKQAKDYYHRADRLIADTWKPIKKLAKITSHW